MGIRTAAAASALREPSSEVGGGEPPIVIQQTPAPFVRYLPYVGLVLVLGLLVAWTVLTSMSVREGLAIAAGVGAMLYAGKEVGIPVGLAAGADPATMAIFVLVTDLAVTFFVYPTLRYAILAWMERPGVLGAYLRHVRDEANKHRGFVMRHRQWGLFVFMLIPFAINGPLVGALLGRLIGMRSKQIVPTLIAAVAITTLGWSLIYTFGFRAAESQDPLYPKLITGAILLIVICAGIVSYVRARRAHHREVNGPEPSL